MNIFKYYDGDSGDQSTTVNRRPRFHLLISAQESNSNLCRSLLSAAALNYPSPVLINYGSKDSERKDVANGIHKILDFLSGDEAQGDDLILIMEEGTDPLLIGNYLSNISGNWFQLPAEVIVGRFLHGTRVSDTDLLNKYGRKPPNIDINSVMIPLGSPRYNQRVLFSAQKECSNAAEDLACYSAPQSPLLTEIYGPQPEEYPGSKLDLPRYLGPTLTMGRVADLRKIYDRSKEILEADASREYSAQEILAQIFGKQEYVRSVRADALNQNPDLSPWAGFIRGLRSKPLPDSKVSQEAMNIKLGQNYEFGIGLDYMGSVFQVLHNSTEDTRFVIFKQPPIIAWASLPPTSAFENLIQLPQDLLTDSPFAPPTPSGPGHSPPLHPELDSLPTENASWPDVELLTNIIVPSSSVPSVVNFRGNESLQDEWWHKMWYQRYGRALFRQHLRNPKAGVAVKMVAEGDEQWWGYRGGRGGAWTDNGTWLEWNEVCGGFEEEVFGDGWGRFGAELETREDGSML